MSYDRTYIYDTKCQIVYKRVLFVPDCNLPESAKMTDLDILPEKRESSFLPKPEYRPEFFLQNGKNRHKTSDRDIAGERESSDYVF